MEVRSVFWQRRLHGSIAVQPLKQSNAGPREFIDRVISRSRYEWQPPYQITRLPSWFRLALDCYVTPGGTRRFTLIETSESDPAPIERGLGYIASARGLSLVASVGGYRLMLDRGDAELNQPLTHDEARLFLQHIEHRREYLGPRKRLGSALRVCAGGRSDKSIKSILPDDLGLDSQGNGKAWDLARLKRAGKHAAHDAGIDNPTPRQVLSYGLLEAAKLNPLYLDTLDESATVIRMALFALSESTDEVTEKQLSYVATHVRSSLRDHLDDSDEQFKKWIADPDSNLLHRIEKRPDCRMSRDQVKHALLELGWTSMRMLGQCIDVQMTAFRDAIPVALTAREDFYYRHAYLANPAYGGLPLLLLRDRYEDLSAAITNVWNNPCDRGAIAVLHRVMLYYAALIGNRRAADRMYKRCAMNKAMYGRVPVEETLLGEPAAASDNWEQCVFSEIATRLATARGLVCEFGHHDWQSVLISTDKTFVCLNLRCPDLGFNESITVPRAEFEAVAKIVRELQ